ncbi:MAG: hypothetical protein Q9227_001189 [Pyrenula ochraceoflavens]
MEASSSRGMWTVQVKKSSVHNQECQYLPSKKRQSTKRSVESAPSEKFPESQTRIDGGGAINVAIGAPDSAQLSPGLIPRSAGTDSLKNGSHKSTQGITSISEDHLNQNTVPSVPDEYVETVPWNVDQMPPLPSTDTGSIQDYNASSWPLFTMDNDWQFDFDIPLTADPINTSTAVSSTALTELDMSPMYSRSIHSLDSTASSAELIASLGLTEKVPTGGFLDPIPSINFSLKAIFSIQDRWLESTILAMTTVSEQIDESIHSELLTAAVSCARALKLENRDYMHNESKSSKDQDLARRSLWFLYSVEVSHSLRRGISPALDHDWIDHAPPQADKETDWFPLQCLYATVMSSAAKMLYNQRALRQSPLEREQKLEMAYKLLEGWRNHLPAPLTELHKHDMQRTLEDHQMRNVALTMFRQYHEAIFLIFFPWSGSQSVDKVSEDCRRRSMELCVNSAQVVLGITNQISSLDILDR